MATDIRRSAVKGASKFHVENGVEDRIGLLRDVFKVTQGRRNDICGVEVCYVCSRSLKVVEMMFRGVEDRIDGGVGVAEPE